LTRVKDYSIADIDNETLEASKGNANAFLEAATVEIDGAIHSAARSLAIAMYRDGSGVIGQIAATTTLSSQVIQLQDLESVTTFEVGQQLAASASTTGSVRSGTLTVTNVDRDLAQVTCSAPLNTGIPAIAANDYLSVAGDFGLKLSGLDAWLPATAPAPGSSFFTVDRSSDASRLAGIRFDGSAMPIEEALVSAAARAAREGGKPDHCFLSYTNFANLEKALGSKVQYIDLKANAEVGFRGMIINGPRGPIKVIPDQNCPSYVAYMLQLDVWKLYSLGKAPKILDTDGLKMLRDASSDSVQIRVGYYAQVGCRAPGWNVRVKLST